MLRIFIWLVAILSFTGNAISIIWHLSGKWKDYIIVNSLIVNLSIADFLMGIYLIFIASANIYFAGIFAENNELWFRSAICLISSFLVSVSALMSTFILFLITLDRYLHLVYPFQNYRPSFSQIIILFSVFWAISIIFTSIPLIYGANQPPYYRLYGTNGACLPGNIENPYLLAWLLIYSGTTFLVWIMISTMYLAINITLLKSRQRTNRQINSLEKIVIAKMITIVTTDLICWLPFYIIVIIGLVNRELDTHTLPFIAVLSLPLNSCINPILYTIFTQTFIDYMRTIRYSLQYLGKQMHFSSEVNLLKCRNSDRRKCKHDLDLRI